MQRKQIVLGSIFTFAACAFLALSAVSQAAAADASGTWTWSRPGRNGGEAQKTTLTLKVDGEKLTGSVTSPGRQGADRARRKSLTAK